MSAPIEGIRVLDLSRLLPGSVLHDGARRPRRRHRQGRGARRGRSAAPPPSGPVRAGQSQQARHLPGLGVARRARGPAGSGGRRPRSPSTRRRCSPAAAMTRPRHRPSAQTALPASRPVRRLRQRPRQAPQWALRVLRSGCTLPATRNPWRTPGTRGCFSPVTGPCGAAGPRLRPPGIPVRSEP